MLSISTTSGCIPTAVISDQAVNKDWSFHVDVCMKHVVINKDMDPSLLDLFPFHAAMHHEKAPAVNQETFRAQVIRDVAAEGLSHTTALIMPYVISLPMPRAAGRFSLAGSRSGSLSAASAAPFPTPPAPHAGSRLLQSNGAMKTM